MSLTAEDRQWIDGLASTGEGRERTCQELHAVLFRAARFELGRTLGPAGLSRPDLDDIACQSASDALLLVIRKAAEFRGDSRFTTWATRFVAFEVKAKLRRHLSRPADLPLWYGLGQNLAASGHGPDIQAEAGDLADAIRAAAGNRLTARQQAVFWGLLGGEPPGVLGLRLGLTVNAIYQTMFRARQRLRAELSAQGFLE